MRLRPPTAPTAPTALAALALAALAPAPAAQAAAGGVFACSGAGAAARAAAAPAGRTALPAPPRAARGRVVASRAPSDPWLTRQPLAFRGCAAPSMRLLWERYRGVSAAGAPVVVAVVDSGVDADVPDLRGALWTNPGEVAGNGLDDDGNGYADDVHGTDIADRDADPRDAFGHGTEVAGIIAARGDNGIGIAGAAWGASIMPVRVLDAAGAGDTEELAEGIRYAARNGARVINVSLNTDADPEGLRDAIAEARARDALVVASAGNDGRDLDARPSFPAASTDPAVVAVAATDASGRLAGFSNRGAGAVDLAADGVDLPTTGAGGGYEWFSGTSASAALVSGVAALVRGAAPAASAAQVRAALLGSATRRPGLAVAAGAAAPLGAVAALDPAAAGPVAARAPAPAAPVSVAGSLSAVDRRTGHPHRDAVVRLTASAPGACTVTLRGSPRRVLRVVRVRVRLRAGRATIRRELPVRTTRVRATAACGARHASATMTRTGR